MFELMQNVHLFTDFVLCFSKIGFLIFREITIIIFIYMYTECSGLDLQTISRCSCQCFIFVCFLFFCLVAVEHNMDFLYFFGDFFPRTFNFWANTVLNNICAYALVIVVCIFDPCQECPYSCVYSQCMLVVIIMSCSSKVPRSGRMLSDQHLHLMKLRLFFYSDHDEGNLLA